MIDISYSEFFLLICSAWMLHIVFLWYREYRRIKRNEWQLSRHRLFHCNFCHHSFVPKQTVSLCRCPRCNTVCTRRSDSGSEKRLFTGERE